MGTKPSNEALGLRQLLLVGYIGLCLVMALFALVLALADEGTDDAQVAIIPATPTLSLLQLTIAAEDAELLGGQGTVTPPAGSPTSSPGSGQ